MKSEPLRGQRFYEWLGDGLTHIVLVAGRYGVMPACAEQTPGPIRRWIAYRDVHKTDDQVDCMLCIGAEDRED